MAIPLFTGRTGSLPDISPYQPPVGSFDPAESALAGARLGEKTPSTLTAIEQGAEGAVKNYQQGVAFEMNQQLLQQKMAEEDLDLQQRRNELELQPKKIEATRAQLDLVKATSELKLQEISETSKAEAENVKRKIGVNSLFSTIREGNVEEGLSALEQNYPDLIKTAINFDSKTGKVSIDPALLSNVSDLPYRAQKTGNPELVQRAQALVGRFQDTVNDATGVSAKKPIKLGEEGQQGQQTPQDFTQATLEQLKSTPPGQGAPAQSQPQQAQQAPIVGARPAEQPQPQQGQQAPQQGQGASPTRYATPITFPGKPPQSGLSPLPPSLDPNWHAAEEDKPIAEQLLRKGVTPNVFDRKVDFFYQKNIANGLDEKTAQRLAIQQASASKISVTQQKELDKVSGAADQYKELALKARATTERLESLMASGKVDSTAFGRAGFVRQTASAIKGMFTGTNQEQVVDSIFTSLDELGRLQGFIRLSELGFGTRANDTEKEHEAFDILSTSRKNSLEKNLQAVDVLMASAQRAQDINEVLNGELQLGSDYNTAKAAATAYNQQYPALTIGDINGQPFVRRNENRVSPAEFLRERHSSQVYNSRTPEGRTVSKTPADPHELSSKISNEVSGSVGGGPDEGAKEQNTITDPGLHKSSFREAKASDVPDRQPEGVNEATVRRMIGAESSGNPNAVGPEVRGGTAKGLMQLMDDTGKELWKELKFEGEYNPHDPHKNVIMGTTYVNKLLKWFGGDTRLALAAYNAGPGTLDKAVQKAEDAFGTSDWNVVQNYLPEKVKKETIPYVNKIMGDREVLAQERKTPNRQEFANAIDSIQSPKGQQFAQANLTPDGMTELHEASKIKNPEEAKGTFLGKVMDLLVSPAYAEEPGGEDGKPAAKNTENGEDSSPTSSSSDLTGSIQALALGAARTLAFGGDDEIGALLRTAVLHEDYDTALQNTRAIRDRIQQEHPNLYLAGELAGGAFNPAGKVIGTAVKAAGSAIRGAEVASDVVRAGEELNNVSLTKGAVQGALKGARSGAVAGGAQGFGEGEGGVGNRLERGAIGGTIGATLGGPLGAIVNPVANKAATSENLRSVFKYLVEGEGAVKLSPAQKVIFNRLKDSPEEFDRLYESLKANDNPAASYIDAAGGPGKLKQLLDYVSKDPKSSSVIQETAEKRLSSQEGRVADVFDPYVKTTSSTEAFDNLAQTIKGKSAALTRERKEAADKSYSAAADALPKETVNLKPKEKPILYDFEGKAIPGKSNTRDVPVFQSKPIQELIDNNDHVKKAIAEARTKLQDGKVLPANSLELLHEAKGILRERGKVTGRFEGKQITDAHSLLREAMHTENPAYGKADDLFKEDSDLIDQFRSKGVQQIEKYFDPADVTNIDKVGDKLFSFDERTISNMMKELSPEEQQSVKDAAAAHLTNQLKKRPERKPNNPQEFPSYFTKNKVPEKINAIFGKDAGGDILKSLSEEGAVASSANTVLRVGSPTATREMEAKNSGEALAKVGVAVASVATAGKYAAVGALRGIASVFKKSTDEAAAKKASKELANILYVNRREGLDFGEKVREKLIEDGNSKALQFWDTVVHDALGNANKRSAKSLSKTVVSAGNQLEPQTEQRKREEAVNTPHLFIHSGG